MPRPITVELVPHDPAWAEKARREIARLTDALGDNLLTIYHIGSTTIPGIHAKPIIDLLPVVRDLSVLEQAQPVLEGLGFAWWGEYGLPGRRYCTLSDLGTGKRLVQVHCYEVGSSAIERHVAFRDYVLAHPAIAQDYDRVKARCRDCHPVDSHAYTDCKNDWIKWVERDAIDWNRSQGAS